MKPYYEDGSVTIYHGDCREVLPAIDVSDVDLLLADPPYGMNYQHGARKGGALLGFDGEAVVGDDKPFDPTPFLGFPNIILWGANHYADKLPPSRGWLVWDKRGGITPNDQSDCELAWTNFSGTARLFFRYWNGGGIGEERYHPTQKALGLIRWCIELAPATRTVLDPYMGSGTTLRAAKDLGRHAIGIEIEERYCEIAAKRLSQETLGLSA